MVGHDDRHRVDILAIDHLAEVAVGVAALVLARRGLFGIVGLDLVAHRLAPKELLLVAVAVAGLVDVGDGHDLDVVEFEKLGHVDRALIAAADDPQGDAIARRIGR